MGVSDETQLWDCFGNLGIISYISLSSSGNPSILEDIALKQFYRTFPFSDSSRYPFVIILDIFLRFLQKALCDFGVHRLGISFKILGIKFLEFIFGYITKVSTENPDAKKLQRILQKINRKTSGIPPNSEVLPKNFLRLFRKYSWESYEKASRF